MKYIDYRAKSSKHKMLAIFKTIVSFLSMIDFLQIPGMIEERPIPLPTGFSPAVYSKNNKSISWPLLPTELA